jgi:hypothetical protein
MGAYSLVELASGERQFVLDASEYGDGITIIAAGIDLPTDEEAVLVDWFCPDTAGR